MTSRLHVFTSSAVNYLPKVRTLFQSVRRFHPEARLYWVLADERPAWLSVDQEPFDEVLEMAQLGIPHWRGWAFSHDIVELSTAVKPFALEYLLAREDCAAVLYFDPDMVLFSRVDDLLDRLGTANILLTPHQTRPETDREAVLDNEVCSLKHGIFNLGFIGVAPTVEGRRFARWWAERIYHFCRAEIADGLFTDQKWINHVPVFFEGVAIIKSSRHNVATWNLTTRTLEGDVENGFRVDGEPLGFYHFTGFDSGAHRLMAVKNASGNAAVQRLIAWYDRETAPGREDPVTRTPWAYGHFADGTPIAKRHRWLYRENPDLPLAFPNPFACPPDRQSFHHWCETEGRVRFPRLFEPETAALPAPAIRQGMTLATAWRLLFLALTPRAGRLLRQRIAGVWRAQGWRGLAQRLRGT